MAVITYELHTLVYESKELKTFFEVNELIEQHILQKILRDKFSVDVFNDCIGSGKYFSVVYGVESELVYESDINGEYEHVLNIGLIEGVKYLNNKKKNKKKVFK